MKTAGNVIIACEPVLNDLKHRKYFNEINYLINSEEFYRKYYILYDRETGESAASFPSNLSTYTKDIKIKFASVLSEYLKSE